MHNYFSSVLLSVFMARRWFTLWTENSLTTHSVFLLTSHRLSRRMCHSAQATQVVFRQGQQLGGLLVHTWCMVTQWLSLEPLRWEKIFSPIWVPMAPGFIITIRLEFWFWFCWVTMIPNPDHTGELKDTVLPNDPFPTTDTDLLMCHMWFI